MDPTVIHVAAAISGVALSVAALFLTEQERLGRLVIGSQSRNRNQFTFRITKGSQFSAKHAPCIYIDRAVQPFRLGNRRMPINHHRLATILSRRPVVTHWESVFVRLPGGLAIERKIAHFARTAS